MNSTDSMIENRLYLGFRIKKLRAEQRLSQEQLGMMVGRDRSFISRIERGKSSATFDTILILAGGLGTTPSQLLEGISLTAEDDQAPSPIRPSLDYSYTHF